MTMHFKHNLEQNILLSTSFIASAGVYAALGLISNQILTFLTAFSNKKLTYKNVRIFSPNSKLPSFLLGIILIVAVVAVAATVSFTHFFYMTAMLFIKAHKTLIDAIKKCDPRGITLLSGAHLSMINAVFSGMPSLYRMVDGVVKKEGLTKFFTRALDSSIT